MASSGKPPDLFTETQLEAWDVSCANGALIHPYFSMLLAMNWKKPKWLLISFTVAGGFNCAMKSSLALAGEMPCLLNWYPIQSMHPTPRMVLNMSSLILCLRHSLKTSCKVSAICSCVLHKQSKSSMYVRVFFTSLNTIAMSFENEALAPWSPWAQRAHMYDALRKGNVNVVHGWLSGASPKW